MTPLNEPSPEPRHTDWFWEGNVQAALAAHLQSQGWTLLHSSDTANRQHGIDLLMTRDGIRLIIEVKGFPSTVYARGEKAGHPKASRPQTQARHWFSHAILSALTYHGTTPDQVAIGLPDFGTYRGLLEKTREPLRALGIGIYLVSSDGAVDCVCMPTR